MPTLEEILQKNNKANLNLVVTPRVNTINQEDLDNFRTSIDALIESGEINPKEITMVNEFPSMGAGNKPSFSSNPLEIALKSNSTFDTYSAALKGLMTPEPKLESESDIYTKNDYQDQLERYDFPLYASTIDSAEKRAFNNQSSIEAITKGQLNIPPIALGIGAQLLGGVIQLGVESTVGDDDGTNPLIDWGKDFMENHTETIYQDPNGTFNSPKSAIAAGADIIGQFGSVVGSMAAMSPLSAGIVATTTAIGSLAGPPGATAGYYAGIVGAAALGAYAEGAIEAADVYQEKKKELEDSTNNYVYAQETAKAAASMTANQNLLLNTALNLIPVMWSVKPYGVNLFMKNATGAADDVKVPWSRLQQPFIPQKLASETAEQFAERLAKIQASGYASNLEYSLINRPWQTIKNLGKYKAQKAAAIKYNVKHPIEFLRRNWDIVGETVGEGLEEYHNYFARQQGLALYDKDEASSIPNMSKLLQGYKDMLLYGEGAHDLVAGAIIGGMSAPLFSTIRYGRTKVFNPDTNKMEFKFDRNKYLDFIPLELNREYEQKEYEATVKNSLDMLQNAKELSKLYISTDDDAEKEKIMHRLLIAPITHYVDNNTIDAYTISLESFAKNINDSIIQGDDMFLKSYLNNTQKSQYDSLKAEKDRIMGAGIPNPADAAKLANINIALDSLKQTSVKEARGHLNKINDRIDFTKKTAKEYAKVKETIEGTYGGMDYGYANMLFKNKSALESEQILFNHAKANLDSAENNLRNKIMATNPSLNLTSHLLNVMFNNEVSSATPTHSAEVEEYLKAKKDYYSSSIRLSKFKYRYNSLNSWGYENDADLLAELDLIEEIGGFYFTDDELRELGNKDNMLNYVPSLKTLISQLQNDLNNATNSADRQKIQDDIDLYTNFLNSILTDPVVKKYTDYLDLVKTLQEVFKKQISNQQNFKSGDNKFKSYNPLNKYVKRNKLITDELKKMSKAKRDIDIINDIVRTYKMYADIFSDFMTEKDKDTVFEKGVEELEKLIYRKALDINPQEYDIYSRWLGKHDLKHKEVLDLFDAMLIKHSANPEIVNYIKRMITMMNYQKDVVDQLKVLTSFYTIKQNNSNINDIIDSFNKNIIDIDTAINNINSLNLPADSIKEIMSLLNSIKAGGSVTDVSTVNLYDVKDYKYYYDSSNNIVYSTVSLTKKYSYVNGRIEIEDIISYSDSDGNIITDITGLDLIDDNFDIKQAINPNDLLSVMNNRDLLEKFGANKFVGDVDIKQVISNLRLYITEQDRNNINFLINDVISVYKEIADIDLLSGKQIDSINLLLFMINNREVYDDYKINDKTIGNILTDATVYSEIIDDVLTDKFITKTGTMHYLSNELEFIVVNKFIKDNNLFNISNDNKTINIIDTIEGFTKIQLNVLANAFKNNDFTGINFSFDYFTIDLNNNTVKKTTFVFDNNKFDTVTINNDITKAKDRLMLSYKAWINTEKYKNSLTNKFDTIIEGIKNSLLSKFGGSKVEDINFQDIEKLGRDKNKYKKLYYQYFLLQEKFINSFMFLSYISLATDSDKSITDILFKKHVKNTILINDDDELVISVFDKNTDVLQMFTLTKGTKIASADTTNNTYYIVNNELVYVTKDKIFTFKEGKKVDSTYTKTSNVYFYPIQDIAELKQKNISIYNTTEELVQYPISIKSSINDVNNNIVTFDVNGKIYKFDLLDDIKTLYIDDKQMNSSEEYLNNLYYFLEAASYVKNTIPRVDNSGKGSVDPILQRKQDIETNRISSLNGVTDLGSINSLNKKYDIELAEILYEEELLYNKKFDEYTAKEQDIITNNEIFNEELFKRVKKRLVTEENENIFQKEIDKLETYIADNKLENLVIKDGILYIGDIDDKTVRNLDENDLLHIGKSGIVSLSHMNTNTMLNLSKLYNNEVLLYNIFKLYMMTFQNSESVVSLLNYEVVKGIIKSLPTDKLENIVEKYVDDVFNSDINMVFMYREDVNSDFRIIGTEITNDKKSINSLTVSKDTKIITFKEQLQRNKQIEKSYNISTIIKGILNDTVKIYNDNLNSGEFIERNKKNQPFNIYGNLTYIEDQLYKSYEMNSGNVIYILDKYNNGQYYVKDKIINDHYVNDIKYSIPFKGGKVYVNVKPYPSLLPTNVLYIDEFIDNLIKKEDTINMLQDIIYKFISDKDKLLNINDNIGQNKSNYILYKSFLNLLEILLNKKGYSFLIDDLNIKITTINKERVIIYDDVTYTDISKELVKKLYSKKLKDYYTKDVEAFFNFIEGIDVVISDIVADDIKDTEEDVNLGGTIPLEVEIAYEEYFLVLNTEAAIAESDRELNKVKINYYKSYHHPIFGNIIVSDEVFRKRKADKQKFLGESIALKDDKLKIYLEKYDIGESLDSVEKYEAFLSDYYDKNIAGNFLAMYDEGLIEFLYFFTKSGDNWVTRNIDDSIVQMDTTDSRKDFLQELYYQIITPFYYNVNSLAKEVFILSNTPFTVSTKDDLHLGFLHELKYLLDEKRSISLLGNNIFNKDPQDLFSEELEFVLKSMNFKQDIFNKFKQLNPLNISVNAEFANSGKLNKILTGRVTTLYSLRKADKKDLQQLSIYKESNKLRFRLLSFAGDNTTNLYEEFGAIEYLYKILLPLFNYDMIKLYSFIESNFGIQSESKKINLKLMDTLENISISDLENLIITNMWHEENSTMPLSYFFITKNPFSGNKKIYLLSNNKLKNLSNKVAENFNEDTITDDQLDYTKKIDNYMKLFNITLVKNTLDLFTNMDSNVKLLIDKDLMDTSAKIRALRKIYKTKVYETFDRSANLLFTSGRLMLNKKFDTNYGQFVIYYNQSSNTLSIILTVRENNIVKALDVITKEYVVYKVTERGDNEILETAYKTQVLNNTDMIAMFEQNIQSIFLNMSQEEYDTELLDGFKDKSLGIETYGDIVKIITNTHINGVEGYYFINPIIQLSLDAKETVIVKEDTVSNEETKTLVNLLDKHLNFKYSFPSTNVINSTDTDNNFLSNLNTFLSTENEDFDKFKNGLNSNNKKVKAKYLAMLEKFMTDTYKC
ncbi:MAG TPA: hypothetical protein PKD00_00365 [Burkholderiales bacterium]|nr:hypothetical protein [Burkholderiales bacterium]